MFHLSAFTMTGKVPVTWTFLSAVQDTVLFTSGNDLRIARGYEYLWGISAFIPSAVVMVQRVTSPKLRTIGDEYAPFVSGSGTWANIDDIGLHPAHPVQLGISEAIRMQLQLQSGTDAVDTKIGSMYLGSGAAVPVSGEIRRVGFTCSTTSHVVGTWTEVAASFVDELPAGRYQVVGCKMWSTLAGACLFRLIFPGQSPRPGDMMAAFMDIGYHRQLSDGNAGVWGEFDINQPPRIETISTTSANARHVGVLEVIKIT